MFTLVNAWSFVLFVDFFQRISDFNMRHTPLLLTTKFYIAEIYIALFQLTYLHVSYSPANTSRIGRLDTDSVA